MWEVFAKEQGPTAFQVMERVPMGQDPARRFDDGAAAAGALAALP